PEGPVGPCAHTGGSDLRSRVRRLGVTPNLEAIAPPEDFPPTGELNTSADPTSVAARERREPLGASSIEYESHLGEHCWPEDRERLARVRGDRVDRDVERDAALPLSQGHEWGRRRLGVTAPGCRLLSDSQKLLVNA